MLAEDAELGTVDDLLACARGRLRDDGAARRHAAARARRAASIGRRAALERGELPSPQELAALYDGLRRTAARERRPLLEVSAGIGLAFFLSARQVGRDHVVVPYREDWRPLRREGFAAYARRTAGPYRAALAGHFDPDRRTWTDRVLARVRR